MPSEEKTKVEKQTKGQNQRQGLLSFNFKVTLYMRSLSAFAWKEVMSPCEAVFQKLQSSIIHETSQNQTNHQVHIREIKCYHPFQLLPPSIWEMEELLNSVKLFPWVGREKAVSQRMSPGFHSMSPHLSWLYGTAQAQLTEVSFFVMHYKLLLLMQFFIVMLRKI